MSQQAVSASVIQDSTQSNEKFSDCEYLLHKGSHKNDIIELFSSGMFLIEWAKLECKWHKRLVGIWQTFGEKISRKSNQIFNDEVCLPVLIVIYFMRFSIGILIKMFSV
jgi:hypothetical protein